MTDVDVAADDDGFREIGFEPGFDGIRGIGAVFVVAVHLFMIVTPEAPRAPSVVAGSFVFMDAFFVLSAFLITSLLLKELHRTDRISLIGFYRRRALRLLPPLALLLVVHYVYASAVGYDMERERRTIFGAATFSLNFQLDSWLSPVSRGLTQLWSLSLEEQFYLVWPVVVTLFLPLRRSLRVVVTTLVLGIVVISVRRVYLWDQGAEWMRLYSHTDTRADSFLLGALIGQLWVRRRTPTRYLPAVAWVAVAFLAWAVLNLDVDSDFGPLGGYNVLALAWAAILLATLEGRWALCRLLETRPLLALGRLSYGIYLWHVPVQWAVADHGRNLPVGVRVVLATFLTWAATYGSWKLVEQPLIRYKNRLERSRSQKKTAAVAVPAPAPADAS